jgi:hypothetical protein
MKCHERVKNIIGKRGRGEINIVFKSKYRPLELTPYGTMPVAYNYTSKSM